METPGQRPLWPSRGGAAREGRGAARLDRELRPPGSGGGDAAQTARGAGRRDELTTAAPAPLASCVGPRAPGFGNPCGGGDVVPGQRTGARSRRSGGPAGRRPRPPPCPFRRRRPAGPYETTVGGPERRSGSVHPGAPSRPRGGPSRTTSRLPHAPAVQRPAMTTTGGRQWFEALTSAPPAPRGPVPPHDSRPLVGRGEEGRGWARAGGGRWGAPSH